MKPQTATVSIVGLGCAGGGAGTVERALADAPGVLKVYVNPATEKAYVTFDPSRIGPEQLATIIRATGYRGAAEVG